jgi:phosphatidylserine decarboxylase
MVGSIVHTAKEGQRVKKGDELGYFAFGGSTVLLFFLPGVIEFDADLLVNSNKPIETLIKMGDSIGKVITQ